MGYWRLLETAADDPDEAIAIGKRAPAAAIKRKTLGMARPAGKRALAQREGSRSAEAADKPAKRHKSVAAPGDRLKRRPAIRAACEG